jgi:signal transduction histidine kinase
MKRGASEEIIEQARSMMERQLEYLVRLVDDLLDVSRIIRNKIELRKEPLDMAAVISRAVETAQPVIDAHGHKLLLSPPKRPITVHGDLIRLSQIIANLLTNAAVSDKPGRIWLSVDEQVGEAGGEAVVRVSDEGIGIEPEMLPRIFELFVQADHSLARSGGGMGMGLTLVNRLVEMHGGRVSASSGGPGKGSEFVVRLPIRPAAAAQAQPASSASSGRQRQAARAGGRRQRGRCGQHGVDPENVRIRSAMRV